MQPLSRNRRRRKSRRAHSASRAPVPAVLSKPGDEAEVQTPPAAPASPPALPSEPNRLTRRQIMAKLTELGATYNPRANHAALSASLWAAQMAGDGERT